MRVAELAERLLTLSGAGEGTHAAAAHTLQQAHQLHPEAFPMYKGVGSAGGAEEQPMQRFSRWLEEKRRSFGGSDPNAMAGESTVSDGGATSSAAE